jgi:chemotaxis protein MotC
MKQWLRVAFVGASCLWWTSSKADQLVEIRSGLSALHQTQDEIARGSEDGSQFQTVLLDRVTDSLERLPETLLAGPDYKLALVELALGGGERTRMLRLIARAQAMGSQQPLLPAVEAYMMGDMAKAADVFEQAQTIEFGSSHFNHFMELAQGTAFLDSDLEKARRAFERALLYAPGTLVEEVALRRLTRISLKQQDPALFMRCANVYLRRYRASPFAREFLSSFVDGASLVSDGEDMARLGNLVLLLPAAQSQSLLSELTADHVTSGKLELAEIIAIRLRETVNNGGEAKERKAESGLFDILIGMEKASDEIDLLRLQKMEGKLTEPAIQGLLEVARHMAWNIHKPLELSAGAQSPETAKDADATEDFAHADQIVTQAKAVLERLDADESVLQ